MDINNIDDWLITIILFLMSFVFYRLSRRVYHLRKAVRSINKELEAQLELSKAQDILNNRIVKYLTKKE